MDKELEKASKRFIMRNGSIINNLHREDAINSYIQESFVAGANWKETNLWKDAQGDDLPEIDREVVALQEYSQRIFEVVFAHRPNPNGWDGRNVITGKVEHFEPKTYDKGGWNIPDVKYWLNAELPEGIE